jgi:hypothetical protein
LKILKNYNAFALIDWLYDIQNVEYRILTLYRIVSLNKAIASALEEHNNQPFTLKSYSRRQYFEEVEKEALSLLNPLRYPMKKQIMATVMKDSRVRPGEDMHYYAVPLHPHRQKGQDTLLPGEGGDL